MIVRTPSSFIVIVIIYDNLSVLDSSRESHYLVLLRHLIAIAILSVILVMSLCTSLIYKFRLARYFLKGRVKFSLVSLSWKGGCWFVIKVGLLLEALVVEVIGGYSNMYRILIMLRLNYLVLYNTFSISL